MTTMTTTRAMRIPDGERAMDRESFEIQALRRELEESKKTIRRLLYGQKDAAAAKPVETVRERQERRDAAKDARAADARVLKAEGSRDKMAEELRAVAAELNQTRRKLAEARRALEEREKVRTQDAGWDLIVNIVSESGGCIPELLKSSCRVPRVVASRRMAAWVLRQLGASWPQIARFFAECHSTLIESKQYAAEVMDRHPDVAAAMAMNAGWIMAGGEPDKSLWARVRELVGEIEQEAKCPRVPRS